MGAVGSITTRTCRYKSDSLKLKPEFTFPRLLQPPCGYVNVGCRRRWPLSQLEVKSIRSSDGLAV